MVTALYILIILWVIDVIGGAYVATINPNINKNKWHKANFYWLYWLICKSKKDTDWG